MIIKVFWLFCLGSLVYYHQSLLAVLFRLFGLLSSKSFGFSVQALIYYHQSLLAVLFRLFGLLSSKSFGCSVQTLWFIIIKVFWLFCLDSLIFLISKDFKINSLSSILALSIPDEGYFRNVLCTLNQISMFLLRPNILFMQKIKIVRCIFNQQTTVSV